MGTLLTIEEVTGIEAQNVAAATAARQDPFDQSGQKEKTSIEAAEKCKCNQNEPSRQSKKKAYFEECIHDRLPPPLSAATAEESQVSLLSDLTPKWAF
ncbi:hypothetical protein E2562_007319 [Oryza meyeriana var. granulata]|uniref:Uncharacterized protein n=1 Tax=Oryza meyeriana var. granulata TaxID=110450 RepID=A0A6G1CZG9_9ORYZ|nr:hypothetical protein E2562_007319 [Oryza meyeriana var. granulata]